jgi:hypothetical protein
MREQIMPLDEKPVRKFGGAQEGAGRPLGALNRITKDIKEAMLNGAIFSDYARDPDSNDPDVPGSLTRYMIAVANKHPELFFSAVVKLLPKEVRTHLQSDTNISATFHTISEVKRALEAEGFGSKQIAAIEAMLPDTGKPLEEEARDVEEIFERDRS